MDFIQIVLIGIGLAMDAFAVSVCKGLNMTQKIDKKYTITIAAFFGIFQAGMPLLGYFLGRSFADYITAYDHWVAFFLLGLVGVQMIREAFEPVDEEEKKIDYDLKDILLMAIATSIDALAVGITFAFMKVNIFEAVSIIGIITFMISVIGVIVGNIFGMRYKSKAEIAGGVLLILLGSKILLEGLGIM